MAIPLFAVAVFAGAGIVLPASAASVPRRQADDAPLDSGMAAYWFRRAAEQGDALLMLWLGQTNERGEGVEQDRDKALYWYRESARRGRPDAQQALDRLGG